MNFYFCEGCGKRLTDADLDKGEGRNKKLKGVYCKSCAVGVLTMETLPLTQEDATAIIEKDASKTSKVNPPAPLGSSPVSRGTSVTRPRTGAIRIPASVRTKPAEDGIPHLWLSISVGFAVSILGGALLLSGSSRSPSRPTRKAARATRIEKAPKVYTPAGGSRKDLAVRDRQPAQLNTESPPAAQAASTRAGSPKESAPVRPPHSIRNPDEAGQATAAWSALKRFEGVDQTDRETRIKRIQDFLTQHRKGPAIAEAQQLLVELKAAPRSEPMEASKREPPIENRQKQEQVLAQRLQKWDRAIQAGNWDLARRQASEIEKDEALGSLKSTGAAALAAVNGLEEKWGARVEALKNRVGHVESMLFSGIKKALQVKVVSVDKNAVGVQQVFMINRQEKFGEERTWPLSSISEQTWKRILAIKPPEQESDWLIPSLSAWRCKDGAAMRAALQQSGTGPLAAYLQLELHRLEEAEQKVVAQKSGPAEPSTQKPDAPVKNEASLNSVEGNGGKSSKSVPASVLAKLGKVFHGRIVKCDRKTGAVTLFYDFKDDKQLRDFGPEFEERWNRVRCIVPEKGVKMYSDVYWPMMVVRAFDNRDLVIRIKYARRHKEKYKDALGALSFGFADKFPKEKGSYGVLAYFPTAGACYADSRVPYKQKDFKLQGGPLPEAGDLEVGSRKGRYFLKLNNQIIVSEPRKVDHPFQGFTICLHGRATYYISALQIQGRLLPNFEQAAAKSADK